MVTGMKLPLLLFPILLLAACSTPEESARRDAQKRAEEARERQIEAAERAREDAEDREDARREAAEDAADRAREIAEKREEAAREAAKYRAFETEYARQLGKRPSQLTPDERAWIRSRY